MSVSILNAQEFKEITLDNVIHSGIPTRDIVARDRVNMTGNFRTQGSAGRFYAATNKNLLLDFNYTSNIGSIQFPNAGNTLVSGNLEGKPSVGAMGNATYTIGLTTPDGTSGIEPSLSIVYTGGTTNGALGLGFELSGLSIISLGKVHPIITEANSKIKGTDYGFYLDGERLSSKNGTYAENVYGADQTEYDTEIANFSKIVSYGTGVLPSYFILTTKDGTVIEYGRAEHAKAYPAGGTQATPIMWKINKITDKNGNFMTFMYGYDEGESYIDRISYTGNESAGLQPYNDIYFSYERRREVNVQYYASPFQSTNANKLSQTRILTRIEGRTYGNLYRRYDLAYKFDGFYSKLVGIQESTENEKISPTLFQWNLDAVNFDQTFSNYKYMENHRFYQGDFDGDGILDYFQILNSSINTFRFWLGAGGMYECPVPSEYYQVDILDMDNDGTNEVRLRYRSNINNNYALDTYNDYRLKLVNGTYVLQKVFSFDIPNAHIDNNSYVSDIDGNESSEFLVFDQNHNLISPSHLNGKLNLNHGGDIHILDINADGKTEILSVNGSEFKIFRYDKTTGVFALIQQVSGWFGADCEIRIIDQNGDGNNDVLYVPKTPEVNKAYVCLSNAYVLLPPSRISDDNFTHYSFEVGDFNGDSKTDVINYNTYDVKPIYYSTGLGFTKRLCNVTGPMGSWNPTVLDFNGDGFSDIYTNGYIRVASKSLLVQNNLLDKIVDDKVYQFTYEQAIHSNVDDAVYKKTKTSNSIKRYYGQLPLWLASKISDNYGREIKFQYLDFTYDCSARKSLGFMATASWSQSDNNYTYTENEFEPLIKSFIPKTTKTYTYDRAILLSQTDNVSEYDVLASDYYRIVKLKSTSQDFTNNVKTEEEVNYDVYGNQSNSVTKKYNNNVLEYTETSTSTYISVNSWVPNLPSEVTSTAVYKTEAEYIRKNQYGYDSKGNLIQTIEDPNSTAPVTTVLSGFSPIGIPNTVTISAPNVETKVSKSFHDPTSRFVIRKINVLNQEEKHEYDVFGNPIKFTNISGNITAYRYNSYGHLLEKVDERGTRITYIEGTQQGTGYRVETVECPSEPKHTKYYNAENLLLKEEIAGYNGLVVVNYEYNAKTNTLKRQTKPYYEGQETPVWKEFTYDYLNRLKTVKLDAAVVTYTYEGLKLSITDPAKRISSKLYDCLGNVVETTEPGNIKVALKYNSAGNLIQSSTGGATVTNQYDLWGRRTQMADPNAGTISTSYDAYGRVKLNQTPRNATSYTYDIADRVTSENDQEGSKTYVYTNAGPGLNNIAYISHSNGSKETFEYNQYGELVKDVKTIDGQAYAFEFANDIYGNLINVKYPSGFSVTRKYNTDGILNEVVRDDNNKSIWKLLNTRANGDVTQTQLGQYNFESKEYDPVYDFVKSVKTKKGTNSIYEQGFVFNPLTGNLTAKTNPTRGLNGAFEYDNLDRLTLSSNDGNNGVLVEYNNNGNINSKWGVGTYQYDNTRVHAVKNVTNLDGGISTSTQAITYTKFDKVATITEGTSSYELKYGVDNQRYKSILKRNGQVYKTTLYFDLYEKETIGTAIKEYHYIETGEGLSSVYIKYPNTPANNQMYYMATDYLGSILALVNENGDVAEEMYYDPWGRRKNPVNWSNTLSALPTLLPRGYTGHEHLDDFKLIDMNGRVFDPVLARFLSPDNFIQDPLNSQSYNRYAYGFNNPLKYNDPDGQWVHIAIGAGIGAAFNIAANWRDIRATYKKEGLFSATVKGLLYGTTGAMAGAVTTATFGAVAGVVGTSVGGTILAGAVSGSIGSGVTHVYNSTLQGQSPFKGLGKAMLQGAIYGGVFSGAGKLISKYGGAYLSKVFERMGDKAAAKGKYLQAIKYYKRALALSPTPSQKPIWSRKNNPSQIKTSNPAQQSSPTSQETAASQSQAGTKTHHKLSKTIEQTGTIKETEVFHINTQETIRFGKGANQVYHTFRHIEEEGLLRSVVEDAIIRDFVPRTNMVVANQPFNRTIIIQNKAVTYTAFRISKEVINIGRIVVER